ncbi:Inner membrane protein YtfF [compost metagenome]
MLLAPRWRALPRLDRHEWLALGWLSLLGNLIYFVLLAQAVLLAGGAAASLIVGLVPVAVTLVGAKEAGAVKLKHLAMPLVLCCLGVGLIGYEALHAGGPATDPSRSLIGMLCAFGALASWSAYAVGNSRYLARLSHVSAHDWSLLTGVVTGALAVVLGLAVFPGDTTMHPQADWLRFWGVSAAVAVFASVVGNGCWNRASRLLPMTLMGQMIVFETLFGLLYSFLWAHRWPTVWEAWAIVSLVVGITWCASLHRTAPDTLKAPG